MMNAMKVAARISSNPNVQLKVALFHSTPLLCFKKRTYWSPQGRSNHRGPPRRHKIIYKGFSNPLVKQIVVRSINSRSDYIVLQCDYYDYNAYVNEIRSICGPNFISKGTEPSIISGQESGNVNEKWSSWNYRNQDEKTKKSSSQSGSSSSKSFNNSVSADMASERLALGLNATGPLNLEDVKTAYRACAVKWHPDHHQGLSKAYAEEKFKICSAAYRSLCNKLSLN